MGTSARRGAGTVELLATRSHNTKSGFGAGKMIDDRKIQIDLNRPGANSDIPAERLASFEAAARRPLPLRMKYAFIKTYKPVLDGATYRSFDTMEEYRRWCEENLPDWLGYGRL